MSARHSERERIWIALSDLFLDTDIALSFASIERELSASSFSLDALDLILRDEVAPVCLFNLFGLAGEWAGFDEDWLLCAIHGYLSRPAWQRRLGRWIRARSLKQMVPEWPELRARIAARRSA